MHDLVWPMPSNLNSSGYESPGFCNGTNDKNNSNNSSVISYDMSGHGSFEASFDVFYDGQNLGPEGAETFPEINKQKRIRRRNRRRKNARSSGNMIANQSLLKIDDDYNSDDYAETETSSTSSPTNQTSNADFDGNLVTNTNHHIFTQLESSESPYSQSNYQLTPLVSQQSPKLKPIIIDGSNVALWYVLSCIIYHFQIVYLVSF